MYHISEDDFKQLNFLYIQNRAKQLRLNHVFNIFNRVGPEYLRSNSTRVSNSHITIPGIVCRILLYQRTPPSCQVLFIIMQLWIGLAYPVQLNQFQANLLLRNQSKTRLMNEIKC